MINFKRDETNIFQLDTKEALSTEEDYVIDITTLKEIINECIFGASKRIKEESQTLTDVFCNHCSSNCEKTEKIWTPRDIGDYTGFNPDTIIRFIKDGDILATCETSAGGRKKYMVKESSLKAWLGINVLERLYSRKQSADVLGITEDELSTLIKEHRIMALRLGGRYRIRASVLCEYLRIRSFNRSYIDEKWR